MSHKNYMQDKEVYKLFNLWIHSPDPMLLNNSLDRQSFFRFVKACFDFAGHHPYSNKIDVGLFSASFVDALTGKHNKEFIEELRHKSVILFETIIEYEDTKMMPDFLGKNYRQVFERLNSKDDNNTK
jgi:hypothetical protein